jgi:hypothetical protein
MDVAFDETGIAFTDYPFAAASVYPSGVWVWSDVASVDPKCAPPEVRTPRGEVLFVPASQREELTTWVRHTGLFVVRRVDVWGLLLEPFLDTELSEADQLRVARVLGDCGVSPDEAERIRSSVRRAMVAYNFDSGLWDWCGLGLFDVLSALSGELSGARHRLPDEEFRHFYWSAMEIAGRGKPLP